MKPGETSSSGGISSARLRLVLVALLLASPTAAAWAVHLEAPSVAGAGMPFLAEACVEGPPGALVELRVILEDERGTVGRTSQEGVEGRGARYGPALRLDDEGRACRDVEVAPDAGTREATLVARVRPSGGAAKAETLAAVSLVETLVTSLPADAPVAVRDASGRLLLRAPARGGAALLPHVPGAMLPAPLALAVVEVRAPPYAGVVLENAGPEDAWLGGLSLRIGARDVPLPPQPLATGARLFLGDGAPPDVARAHPLALPAARGNVTLLAAEAALSALDTPRLAKGEAATPAGVVRLGILAPPARPLEAHGALVAYATPDAGAAPLVEAIDAARREVLVEGYTLTSTHLAAALLRAAGRGVDVRILLEGAPVGGIPPEEKSIVAALVAGGANVSYLQAADGFPARFRTVHAKALVLDRETVAVATENLHESSYPAAPDGAGTRGYGILVQNATLAETFARVLLSDMAPWPDARPVEPATLPPPTLVLPSAGATAGPTLRLDGARNVTPVFSPGGHEPLLALLAGARARIDVALLLAEPGFGPEPNPLLDAVVDAARRGVRVRLLLDGHLDAERNGAVADALNALAAREGLPLEARLDDAPRALHAKLVLVDGRAAYAGSMNWGRASALDNREAGLIVENATLAGWWGETYEKDWAPEPSPVRDVPAAPWVAALAALLLSPSRPSRSRRPRRRR